MTMVSVITPTWQRPRQLLERCIPSVAAQTYNLVEHVVVSDGPDAVLADLIARGMTGPLYHYGELMGLPLVFGELPDHDPAVRWGVRARLKGIELSRGDYLAWLDDDNSFRPQHVERLAALLDEHPDAGFAYSRIQFNDARGPTDVVGSDPPVYAGIDTSAIMCRRETLTVATFRDGFPTIDWDLVERWLAAGVPWVFCPEITCDDYAAGVFSEAGTAIRQAANGHLARPEAPVTWTLTATGHCESEEEERAVHDRVVAALSEPGSGTSASQFGGQYVNGPAHEHETLALAEEEVAGNEEADPDLDEAAEDDPPA